MAKHAWNGSSGHGVAPSTGAWIEICAIVDVSLSGTMVAPSTGAWIEMIESSANGIG